MEQIFSPLLVMQISTPLDNARDWGEKDHEGGNIRIWLIYLQRRG